MLRTDDLLIPRGATWEARWPLVDAAGAPLVVAGWDVRARIRSGVEILHECSAAIVGSDVVVQVTPAESELWGWASAEYDVELFHADGRSVLVTQGAVQIVGDIVFLPVELELPPVPPAVVVENRYRAFRPILENLSPGVASTMDGRYYFDGVQMHCEVNIKMAANATAPAVGTIAVKPPTEMEMVGSIRTALGIGTAHDATTGSMHPVAAIAVNPNNVTIVSVGNGMFTMSSASLPITWGVLDSLTLKFSYFPVSKTVPKSFAAYGDSITRFESMANVAATWPNFVAAPGLVFGGGYAVDSGTSAQVLANAAKISADAGVCMIGVNDIAQGVPLATTLSNVAALRAKVGTDKFLLCKIAPYNANPAAVTAMNAAYETLAGDNGWVLLDPFAVYRATDGSWVAGASGDGVHPSATVQQAVAGIIRNALLAA